MQGESREHIRKCERKIREHDADAELKEKESKVWFFALRERRRNSDACLHDTQEVVRRLYQLFRWAYHQFRFSNGNRVVSRKDHLGSPAFSPDDDEKVDEHGASRKTVRSRTTAFLANY